MHATGEDHHMCSLTATDVKQIRKYWDNDEASLGWLANEYNVARSTIADIVHRRTWKKV